MYHHHQQQQGPQSFPTPNQPPVRPPGDMMPPPVGAYQFPRPTQLPDELESALSIRGSRDMDHRLIEHLDRLSQLQNQASTPNMGQHGNYGTNPQPKQQSVDWSSYEPPAKLFSSHPASAAHPAQHTTGHAGTSLSNWNAPVGESSAPNPRGRSFYTPESAGTILASFGLSNEDLEALSHYPDDQLTPDTLPFILRDLQVHKTGKPKSASSRSPEVPSLLTITQTEGRVIDYGHASQTKDESGPPKTFKKEPISSERTVKMYPTPAPKLEASVGRQVRLEPAEPIKHGDRDYRRRSSEHHASRSPPPPREFSAKPRHQDRDYRPEQPKPRASAEKRSVEPPVSKPRPAPKPMRTVTKAVSSKKLPTPTMINDFSGVPPKVYPHTCSLCDMQCDQEKEWVGHLETVNHTAACRHLRTKYPNWKPKVSSREYGPRTGDHKRHPAGPVHSRSTSWSPPPPSDKPRGPAYKPRGKAYGQHYVPRHHPYHNKDVDGRFEQPHSHGGSHPRRPPFREPWQKGELSEGSSHMYLKRPHYNTKRFTGPKGDFSKKPMPKYKSNLKPDTTRRAEEGPPAKKKKAPPPLVAHDPECLVYLTDIPKEATEQEVINLAGSFGPINNVLMMPFPDEEEQKAQQASVCMMKAEDAQTFASAPNLLIRDRVITASVAKIPEEEQSSDAYGSAKPEQDGAGGDLASEKKGVVLIEDLPESGWTEEELKALVEPFGYPDDILAAKQISKAVLIFPDMATAAEIVKVHAFSPLSINGHKLKIKQCIRNLNTSTPIALYNCFMQSVKPKGTTWSMLIVVSNVPATPSAASVVHKLVSRIGTVFRSLAVKNLVICEMANGPLGSAVYRHYLKFPCMIQNNPLVFSRKPDPKPTSKVIPAFLDADKDVPENKKEAEANPPENQNEVAANAEPQDEAQQDVEMKSAQTEVEVPENEANEEIKESIEQANEGAEHAETKDVKTETTSEVVNAEKPDQPTDEAVTEEAEGDKTTTTPTTPPKENGTQVEPATDAKAVTTNEGEATPQDTATTAKDLKTASTEQTPLAKQSKKPPEAGKKQASVERGKEPAQSNSIGRESDRRREARERDRRDREARNKERRDRDRGRTEWDHEERNKRDVERERRGDPRREDKREDKREDLRRDWRRDWERREGRRKPHEEGDRRRGDSSKRSYHREERHRSSSRRSTTEEEDFPFNLSDFVTVDEVGDVDDEASDTEAPTGGAPETEMETETEEKNQEDKPSQELLQEADEVTSTEVNTEEPAKAETEEITEAKTEAEEIPEAEAETEEQELTTNTETKDPSAEVAKEAEEERTAVGDESDITDAPCSEAVEETSETNQEESSPPQQEDTSVVPALASEESEEKKKEEEVTEEVPTAEKEEAAEEKQEAETETTSAPPAAEPEKSENGERHLKEVSEIAQSDSSGDSLPPFNPSNPVGMQYLVPMTGFFCKVCTRFFTGAKDTQINHSKSLKHYQNLEKFLMSKQTSASTADAGST